MSQNLMKSGVRILRPDELQRLMNAIPRSLDLIRFETLLYTGARYTEIQKLKRNPDLFNGTSVQMISKKKKAIMDERHIQLNDYGRKVVKQFLEQKKKLPTREGWNRNLQRWCEYARVDPTGVSTKTTRKTWESYLVSTYPSNVEVIFVSQGHSSLTSLKFYLTLGFTDVEKKEIMKFTNGWI